MVNGPFPARLVNPMLVNRSAPDLFPVMSLVKKWFTPRETSSVAALALNAIFLNNALKS